MANYEYINHPVKLNKIAEKMEKVVDLCGDELSKEICCQTLKRWLIDEKSDVLYNGEAYFYTNEMDISDNECLVDAGAFDGDTIQSFKKVTSDKFETKR